MKRIFTIFLVFVLIFSLSSCVLKPIETEPENIEQEENIEEIIEEIPKTIDVNAGVFWYDFSDAFVSTVRDALNTELDALGIEYTNYDAASTQATQNEQILYSISQGANLLIVNIVDTGAEDAAQYIVDTARIANVPVIFFNREISDNVVNSYENACFVGTRAAECGEAQGTMIGKYLLQNYDAVDLNGDGFISYIMMKGELGGPEAEARTHYAVEFCNSVLTAAGKPELIYYDSTNTDLFQPSNWSKNDAYELMRIALSTNPMYGDSPVEIAIGNSDDTALGCVDALNDIGWNTGKPDSPSIPVFGIDYVADAEAAIKAGKMTGSILMSATGIAETVADLVENVMNGEHVFANTDSFNVDAASNKIRVPYEIKLS